MATATTTTTAPPPAIAVQQSSPQPMSAHDEHHEDVDLHDEGNMGYRPMDVSDGESLEHHEDREMEGHRENNNAIDRAATSEYLHGIMQEFQRLEGKLSTLLTEHTRVHNENEELRNRPPPDLAVVKDYEALTVKYNKVKKLYFQREQTIEEMTKEIEGVHNDREELEQDIRNLTKDRDNAVGELSDMTRERDSLVRERNTIVRERDAVVRERDAVSRERDTISRLKEEAARERHELSVEREDMAIDRDKLQNRVHELEEQVSILQQQQQVNGIDKRRSVPPTTTNSNASGGTGYTDEILKLKYDKVKRLYYDQIKTIDALHDQIRKLEAGNQGAEPLPNHHLHHTSPKQPEKGKQRASYVPTEPQQDNIRESRDLTSGVNPSANRDGTSNRRRSVRASGPSGSSSGGSGHNVGQNIRERLNISGEGGMI